MNAQPRFFLPLLLLLALLGACSKEEFAGSPKSDSYTANPVQVFQNQTCANSTLVKPPVDILYLVDNSPSASFLTDTIKQQLRQTILGISSEFDYHVLVAPLNAGGSSVYGESTLPVLTNGGKPVSMGTVVSFESLNVESFFTGTSGASNEQGFNRARTLLNNYRSGSAPVFRQNAHTLVVLVSNGEDSSSYFTDRGFKQFNAGLHDQQFTALRDLGYNTLMAKQFRFFSVTAHTVCQGGYKEGYAYKLMSSKLYSEAVNRGGGGDQSGRATPDSYNLCTSEYASMYAGVNNSIRQEVLDHRYNVWPVTNSTDTNINTNDIQVFKVTSSGTTQIPNAASNGWQLLNNGMPSYNVNTRYYPAPPGEPASGILISLNGSAEVKYPECVVVRTSSPIERYQYVVIPTAPVESSIIIRIRGQQIAAGLPDGWTYEGFRTNQDIKVPGTSNTQTLKTGYFIKLNGNSQYVSGDTVESYYVAAPVN